MDGVFWGKVIEVFFSSYLLLFLKAWALLALAATIATNALSRSKCYSEVIQRGTRVELPPRLSGLSRLTLAYLLFPLTFFYDAKKVYQFRSRYSLNGLDYRGLLNSRPKPTPSTFSFNDNLAVKGLLNDVLSNVRFIGLLERYDRRRLIEASNLPPTLDHAIGLFGAEPRDRATLLQLKLKVDLLGHVANFGDIVPHLPLAALGVACRINSREGPVTVALEPISYRLSKWFASQTMRHELCHLLQDMRLGTFEADWDGEHVNGAGFWLEVEAHRYGSKEFYYCGLFILMNAVAIPFVMLCKANW